MLFSIHPSIPLSLQTRTSLSFPPQPHLFLPTLHIPPTLTPFSPRHPPLKHRSTIARAHAHCTTLHTKHTPAYIHTQSHTITTTQIQTHKQRESGGGGWRGRGGREREKHTHRQTHTNTETHPYTHTHTQNRARARAHTHTRTYTHALVHTHLHTYTHIQFAFSLTQPERLHRGRQRGADRGVALRARAALFGAAAGRPPSDRGARRLHRGRPLLRGNEEQQLSAQGPRPLEQELAGRLQFEEKPRMARSLQAQSCVMQGVSRAALESSTRAQS